MRFVYCALSRSRRLNRPNHPQRVSWIHTCHPLHQSRDRRVQFRHRRHSAQPVQHPNRPARHSVPLLHRRASSDPLREINERYEHTHTHISLSLSLFLSSARLIPCNCVRSDAPRVIMSCALFIDTAPPPPPRECPSPSLPSLKSLNRSSNDFKPNFVGSKSFAVNFGPTTTGLAAAVTNDGSSSSSVECPASFSSACFSS